MSKITDQAMSLILSVFEQGGTQPTPELTALIDMTFGDCDSMLLMKAAVEAMKNAKGRITIADIQKQIELHKPMSKDDHPSAEEAWSMLPKSEDETTFLTDEMQDAMNRAGVNDFLERDDYIGAERAFKKVYAETITKSVAGGRKADWRVSLGHDQSQRVVGLERAVSHGLIDAEKASDYDPDNYAIYLSAEKQHINRLPESERKLLEGRVSYLSKTLLQLAEAKTDKQETDYQPNSSQLNDPYIIERAASLGLSPYEYLVRPCPPQVAAKVHAQLSKKYNVDLQSLTQRNH
jgi:hypothetical protein